MTTSQPPCVRLEKLFHRRKSWMLHPLAERLGYALISVRRFLKQIGYFRSYTHNGKWYTLRNSPNFDRDGLWHFKGIGFSKHGTLTATIGYLVGRSPAGLSARELTQKLRHPCHAVLTQLHQAGRLDRLQLAGQFRYLAPDQELNARQREQAAGAPPPTPTHSLSTQAALWVLVEYIKNPGLSFEQISLRVQEQRDGSVTPESIQRFFLKEDLKKRLRPRVENAADLPDLSGETGPGEFLGLSLRAATHLDL